MNEQGNLEPYKTKPRKMSKIGSRVTGECQIVEMQSLCLLKTRKDFQNIRMCESAHVIAASTNPPDTKIFRYNPHFHK